MLHFSISYVTRKHKLHFQKTKKFTILSQLSSSESNLPKQKKISFEKKNNISRKRKKKTLQKRKKNFLYPHEFFNQHETRMLQKKKDQQKHQ